MISVNVIDKIALYPFRSLPYSAVKSIFYLSPFFLLKDVFSRYSSVRTCLAMQR
jgi:hypothetical protein